MSTSTPEPGTKAAPRRRPAATRTRAASAATTAAAAAAAAALAPAVHQAIGQALGGDDATPIARPPGALDLDALQREGRPEPFVFIHNNRQYTLGDPQDQDWQELLVVLGNPMLFLRLVLPEADRDAFFEASMPAWKLNALTKAYRDHHGLPSMGEADGLPV